MLYEALVTPLYGLKILSFIAGIFLWLLDLFIYPLFLAERFFLLGIMQAFFPLVISLAVFEKFRSLAYNFFKLYAGVYMLVPAFFLVNVFVNNLYTEINTNFWSDLFGTDWGSNFFAPLLQLGSIGFIVLLPRALLMETNMLPETMLQRRVLRTVTPRRRKRRTMVTARTICKQQTPRWK